MKNSLLNDVFGDRMSVLDRPDMRKRAEASIEKLGVKLDPDMLISEMPVGHKQFTEIAREIAREKTRLLVLDEPTAVLTETEAEVLIKALRQLAAKGISIIFISHRLHEIIEVADRVVVLRDGVIVKDTPTEGVTVRDIASWMVGRHVATERVDEAHRYFDEIVLSVKHLWVDQPGETVRDVSFQVHKGEIFGIGGLAGQGKLGLPNGIMGLPRRWRGAAARQTRAPERSQDGPQDGYGLRLRGSSRRGPAPGRDPGVEHRLHGHAGAGEFT